MSVALTRQEIIDLVKTKNLIEHFSTAVVSPASYELRIGSYRDKNSDTPIVLQEGEGRALPPASSLLIGTMERINLPLNLLGMMYLRSSYARLGSVSWFQGLVDPGYSGKLTIVLHNLSEQKIPIVGGDRICHLVFQELTEPADEGYKGLYQNSPGAQTSVKSIDRFDSPLPEIGFKLFSIPESIQQSQETTKNYKTGK